VKSKILLVLACLIIVPLVFATSGCAAEKPAPTPGPTMGTPQEVIHWKLTTFSPSGDSRDQVNLAHFVEEVYRCTQGRIKIETYPGGSLVPNSELPAACADGAVQMVHTVGTFWATKMPVGTVEFYMPMAYESFNDTWTLMWDRGLQDLLRKAYADHGAYMLGFELGTGSYLMTKEPIRTPDDLKGKKIRATGTLGHFFTKLGATAVNIPMGEIYMALKLGTIDGAVLGYEQHHALNHQEVCKYIMATPMTVGDPLDLLVNLNTWNALPEDLKITMDLVCRNFSVWSSLIQNPKINKIATNDYKTAGVEMVELSDADVRSMQAIAVEIWDEWAEKDAYCRQAVQIMKDYFREQGRIE